MCQIVTVVGVNQCPVRPQIILPVMFDKSSESLWICESGIGVNGQVIIAIDFHTVVPKCIVYGNKCIDAYFITSHRTLTV